jgi:oligopeptide/dipeptide ABC transporter ATP-binding protein
VSLLEVSGLTVRYGEGGKAFTAVDGVDLVVPQSGTLGLVGESGCGKSTIARAVLGLTPVAAGRVLIDGSDYTQRRNSRAYRRTVQMVFQDPYASLNPRMTVNEVLREALSIRGVARAKAQKEAEATLDMVGLPRTALGRYPHQFSGGQRQRIAIARALAVGPEVLVLDEATSSLDVSAQATILRLLRSLQRELKLSYLFISHDLSVVRHMSDTVSVMYLGRIVENGNVGELVSAPRHPYTTALIESIPQLTSGPKTDHIVGDLPDPRHPPAGCRFHTRCPIGPLVHPDRLICMQQDPQQIARTQDHHAACHFPLAGELRDGERVGAREDGSLGTERQEELELVTAARTQRQLLSGAAPWAKFILRRAVALVLILAVLACLTFAMVRLIPGDPARAVVGTGGTVTEVNVIRHNLGLDQTVGRQFTEYWSNLVQGDLGKSFALNVPVTELISQRIGQSLQLAVLSLLVILVLAVPLGMLAAALTREGRHRKTELAFTSSTSVLGALPEYLAGTFLAFIFAVSLGLLPVAGADSWQGLILPTAAICIRPIAIVARVVRVEALNVLALDYMRTARSKRLPGRLIYVRHALPNVLTAALTVAGLLFAGIVGSAVVVENVFARPGIGTALISAVVSRDYPVIQGLILVLGIGVVVINAIVDVLIATLDPRSLTKTT